jgi:peptide/nickel transport system permease protein
LIAYIIRRLGAMLIVLFGSTFLVYNLAANMGDPLEGLRTSSEPNAKQQIINLTRELQLDIPSPIRYFLWLQKALTGDLGMSRTGQPVITQLADAIPTSIRLVAIATIVSIILGISLGIVTALRQYSRLDYSVTFYAFLAFSLPIFWFAVLLKQYLAIGFNNFLSNPEVTPPWLIGLALLSAVFWSGIIGGNRLRVAIVFASSFIVTAGTIWAMSATQWFLYPGLGPILILLFGLGIAVGVTQLSTGISNRKTLYSALSVGVFGLAAYYPLQWVFEQDRHLLNILLSLAVFIAVAIGAAFAFNKVDRGPAARTAAITAVLIFIIILVDRYMQTWDDYMAKDAINYRPVPTVGQYNDLLETGNFWITSLNVLMHLFLPTVALAITGFAGYTRFSRGTMLEVMNQDYIRTARAKGLTERTVIMRHAFRNTMIPLTTIMVGDIVGVVGGAIITESIFGWVGMGSLFRGSLALFDLNMIMGIALVTSMLAMLANLIADLLYSALDPRIRIGK